MPIYWLTGNMVDELGGKTSFRYQGDFADDLSADSAASNLLAQLDLLSDAGFEDVRLQKQILFAGVQGAGSRVFEEAFITVETDNAANRDANIRIPAPDGAVFIDGTNTVDETLPALTGLIALFQGASSWRVSDGEEIVSIKRGKRRFVRSGKTNLA